MTTKEKTYYVDYDIAKRLKELGYSEPCNHYFSHTKDIEEYIADYNNEDSSNQPDTSYDNFNHGWSEEVVASAPSIFQVSGWLRDNHKIHVGATIPCLGGWWWESINVLTSELIEVSEDPYPSYEEALREGLRKTLEGIGK